MGGEAGALAGSSGDDSQACCEFTDLVEFVRHGLLDPRATGLISLVPTAVPSGRPVHTFQ